MPDIERTADKPAVAAADGSDHHSASSFFDDAYNRVVTTVKEHPYATAAAVVGGAALVNATKGTALLNAFKYESKAPEDVIFRVGGREFNASRTRGIYDHMVGYDSFLLTPVQPGLTFNAESAAKSALAEFERTGYRRVEARAAQLSLREAGEAGLASAVPINAETRAAAANLEILKLSPRHRPATIGGVGKYVRGECPAERALTALARDQYRDEHFRQALARIRETRVTDLPD